MQHILLYFILIRRIFILALDYVLISRICSVLFHIRWFKLIVSDYPKIRFGFREIDFVLFWHIEGKLGNKLHFNMNDHIKVKLLIDF